MDVHIGIDWICILRDNLGLLKTKESARKYQESRRAMPTATMVEMRGRLSVCFAAVRKLMKIFLGGGRCDDRRLMRCGVYTAGRCEGSYVTVRSAVQNSLSWKGRCGERGYSSLWPLLVISWNILADGKFHHDLYRLAMLIDSASNQSSRRSSGLMPLA